jgi:hypothetical protein
MSRIRPIHLLLLAASAMCSGCAVANRVDVGSDGSLVYLPQDLEVELALAAGPEHVRSEATVYVFGKSGYHQVRSGTNGVTCLVNRDGHQDGSRALRPTCWDSEGSATIVPVVLRVGGLIAEQASAEEIKQDIDLGFQSERFISPRKTGIAYMLKGDVTFDEKSRTVAETVFPPHYMIYALGVSNAGIGMTEEAFRSNPSLPLVYDGYSGGSRTAYIIVVASDTEEHAH